MSEFEWFLLAIICIEFVIDLLWTMKYYDLYKKYKEVKVNDRFNL